MIPFTSPSGDTYHVLCGGGKEIESTPQPEAITYTNLRQNLKHKLAIGYRGQHYRIVRSNQTDVVLAGLADWQRLLETMEILASPLLLQNHRCLGTRSYPRTRPWLEFGIRLLATLYYYCLVKR